MADAGKNAMRITAPSGLVKIFQASRCFFHRPHLQLDFLEVNMDERRWILVCDDENLKVFARPLVARFHGDESSPESARSDDSEEKAAKRMRTERRQMSLCYRCQLNDLPGKFNPDKAKALGLPKGPAYAKLVRGEQVVTPDGRIVSPSDVIGESSPGPVVWIVNVPSQDFIDALPAHEGEAAAFPTGVFRAVVHLCPVEVLRNQHYKKWSSLFGIDTVHILLHDTVTIPKCVFRSSADNVFRLSHLVGEKHFPSAPENLGGLTSSKGESSEPGHVDVTGFGFSGQVHVGSSLMKCVLAPKEKIGIDVSDVIEQVFDAETVVKELENNRDVVCSMEPFQKMMGIVEQKLGLTEPRTSFDFDRKTAEIVFLGTGAALPSSYRNVSSILLNLFDRGCILLDAGEGTYGQLVRRYGVGKADQLVSNLKAIWISHMHADHHLGTVGILSRRRRLEDGRPILVVGPAQLDQWLHKFSAFGHDRFNYLFFDNADLVWPPKPQSHYFEQTLGLRFESVEVIHCPYAYGLVLEDCVNEWKLVYSGDTRPCRNLVERGEGATLAIHEATMGNDLWREAAEKNHCTVREALQVCKAMKAYRTVLTHFSQRYRVPAFYDCDEIAAGNAIVAYDFMAVNFADLGTLLDALPGLMSIYPASDTIDETDVVEANEALVVDDDSLSPGSGVIVLPPCRTGFPLLPSGLAYPEQAEGRRQRKTEGLLLRRDRSTRRFQTGV
eukprot:CAMPEP_0184683898 /NCGR_PEP_ID=MMETSP0312-20130426/13070_1 /TAXON_ID=31354 /ORGANISM="Compsopogon coeruleus, Strain SAG 36.94" /LENGTH=724 /DNA_ID=CAMNT_0027136607 /DNA_START=322 /DNA_END=2497 /DNA_ORIENTATION=+